MRSSTILIFILLSYVCSIVKTIKDEDFSEFDDFDQDEFVIETPSSTSAPSPSSSSKTQSNKLESTNDENIPQSKSTETKDDEVTIDDDDDAMFDEEEFEMSDSFSSATSSPDFKIAEVPANLTGNRWEAYYCEAIMMIALLGYLIHFLIGRTKNSQLATIIYRSQNDLLERNFALVGDNGQTRNTQSSDEQINTMHKESENLYILWCSGRISLDSMLIELRFIKRQCLFNSLAALIKSINDTIVYTIDYGKDDMDTFVFCLARKRCAAKLHRDMNDLSQFCAERKNADKKGLSSNYQILSELGEVSSAIIDTRVAEFMDKFPDAVEYIHVSDQYTGMKGQNGDQQTPSTSSTNTGSAAQQQDALNISERSVRRVLIIAFNLISYKDRSLQVSCENLSSDYLRFVLYLIDRISSFRLTSKDSKMKALKNRQRIDEQFLKNVNQQRQEQAQQRREEQRRVEKEKIMQSDDPELQRKWEEKEHKREMKRRQPKMKQMKIKAM